MLKKEYPAHDMNVVFDMLEETISHGDCHEGTKDEMNFLNRLFAALPAEAVEYGMMFLHGNKNLPQQAQEILPLYIRFVNLVEYCEKIESLREIPSDLTTEAIMERKATMDSLDQHEACFGHELLGFKMNQELPEEGISEVKESSEENVEDSSALHLMNRSGIVFPCEDPYRTALFYETKCGFKALHLSDESMEHIRLERDNLTLIIVKGEGSACIPFHKLTDIKYDLYIYASEPLLLQQELKGAGVTIVEELSSAEDSQKQLTNRQFVFEDVDGRRICVSQQIEEIN